MKDAQDQAINQKNALEKKFRAAQDDARSAREEAGEAQSDLASLDRQRQHDIQELNSSQGKLEKTITDLRAEVTHNSNTLKATQDRLSQRDAEAGELESEILRLKAQTGDSDTLAVIKRELSDQVTHIRKLETLNREQSAELKHLRKAYKAAEVIEEEKRFLESRLGLLEDTQRQLREAQLQREILDDEKKSWTSYLQSQNQDDGAGEMQFESPEEVARAFVRQRVENASLVQQMGVQKSEILERDEMIKQLEEEKTTTQSELEKFKASNVNSSTSLAPPGPDTRTKQRLESQLSFAKKEVALMREQLRSFDAEEQTYTENKFDAVKSQRIASLETLLDEHRRELADLTKEFASIEKARFSASTNNTSGQAHASITSPVGSSLHPDVRASSPLKRPLSPLSPSDLNQGKAEDESTLVGRLTRKLRTLQSSFSTLQSAHSVLQAEHTALTSQLASSRSTNRTRVLTLRANPTDDFESLKLSTIKALRAENKDLLSALQSRNRASTSSSSSGGGEPNASAAMIPSTSLQPLHDALEEKKIQLADREKRMRRLKEIWGKKALEMREAVFSLLGWQIDFRPDGKFALSLLPAPPSSTSSSDKTPRGGGHDDGGDGSEDDGSGDGTREEESLIFDGERGTMKVSGGTGSVFARKVKPAYGDWVQEKGSVPGFMAQLIVGRLSGEI